LKETPFSELIIRGIIQNSQRDWMKPDYCARPNIETCEECSLTNYRKDCMNNPIEGEDQEWPMKSLSQEYLRNLSECISHTRHGKRHVHRNLFSLASSLFSENNSILFFFCVFLIGSH
jgi:hypothetical protein